MGTTKGDTLISYDLDRNHSDVKTSMKKKGYLSEWNYEGGKVYELPNTTLWKPRTSSDEALSDLKNSCKECGAKLEKAVAVLATDWVGI